MEASFETELSRSVTLGAHALWRFSRSFFERTEREEAAPFLSAFLVLPIVFHQATVAALANRVKDGALLKAVAADPTIAVGLQRRMEAMSSRTLRALNLAMSAEMVSLDHRANLEILPVLARDPFRYSSDDAHHVIKAADRLGHSVAGSGFGAVCSLLSVRF